MTTDPENPADFESFVLSQCAPGIPFAAQAVYDRDGDCIEFLFSNQSFRRERLDNLVTVYYGQASKELVGSLIKGVSRVLRKWPGFKIEIEDGRVKLEHVITACMWSADSDKGRVAVLTYRKLREVARVNFVEAQVGNLQEA